MTSKPEQSVDERLTGAHDLALAALREITPADTVGPAAGYTAEDDGAVSLRFHTRLSGYPGWFWTVSVAVVDGADPTVLEVELLPGDGALLAPDWVPWATRLAEYQAAQVAAAAIDEDDDEDLDDDEDDTDDEADDDEDEPKARFHAGDLDGVDIDELDADHPDEADDDLDETDDDDESDRSDESDEDDESDRSDEDDDEGDRFGEDDDEGDRSY
ncbi:hypothetical protein FHS07_002642 [Microbacterium proteolyticum]|uniref:DUF3027 domain-containing protein n=1 Tax=Microbacterium proteolyticum TaxID=1572644 RepID=A0A7W5CKC1_9MICO|nr:DUF3027 domain-containing protein [Microbacterium proteolyticum]MBB3158924.1 hypothetical protein [Microbacterium proteolyticum]